MKHAFRFALAVLTIAALQATVAFADPVTYTVDKSHTEVGFDIRHFFSKVHGRFNSFTAKIVFDEKTPANISVEASADANSIWTDNERRDGHLKSADFFDAEKFPVITFKSTKVVATGKNKYKITGDFTMHGVTKPVTFDAEFLGAGAVGVGGQSWGTKAGFTATTVINRKDFGVSWNKALDNGGAMLSDEVTINLNIEADAVQAAK
ncbi:MAG: YceI family protein [Candidatus Eisenbacteria bacterium]|uniref:YceI family protein n=1 Tax=Eiseniibacteriota bacterium TaxID=2212470 RepID=A0A933S9H4_UNCEI|nr:YceI family protein [Candidatus Eisenbacteria bacterium]